MQVVDDVEPDEARLCADSSDRGPRWLLPVIRHQVATGGEVKRSAAVVAAWARCAEGVDGQGREIEVVDRLAAALVGLARRQREDPWPSSRNREIFGDLADDDRFVRPHRWALQSLHDRGSRATLEARPADGGLSRPQSPAPAPRARRPRAAPA